MYVILLVFVLLFLCSLFYFTTKESTTPSQKEGFAANMYSVLPVKVTGTSDADYTLSVPNRINANRGQSAITFGGDLISAGKLNVKGTLLEAENDAVVRKDLTVTGTINAGYVHKNQHSAIPPVGSIMAYAGTADPDGWVICDGVSRTETDGRYNQLITLGIGSGTANTTYTPPNLKNQFLKGAESADKLQKFDPKTKVTLTTDNLPAHKHTGTTDGMNKNAEHSHSINDPGHKHIWNHATDLDDSGTGDHSDAAREYTKRAGQQDHPIRESTTGITIQNAYVGHEHSFTTGDTGGGTAFDTPDPSNYSVNYILKY